MRKLILLTVLALEATVARAETGLFYLGAGLSYNSVTNVTVTTIPFLAGLGDIKGSSWKAFAGVRPTKLFAVEADYMDLGNGHTTRTFGANECLDFELYLSGSCDLGAHSHGSAYAGYLVGFLPIPLPIWDIYAKAGAAHWKLNVDMTPGGYITPSSFSQSGTDFAWGIGVQAHFTMFGARLEYESFSIPNTSGAKIASLSVFLKF